MESNSSQVKIYTDYSDTTFIGKFTILPICFRSPYEWDNSDADFTYILETWASSCQPPEGYECLVCDQQYLVLRYWNEKLKTQFARHKKINPEESSSKSSFWFRSTENLKHMTCNLYIKIKIFIYYLISESATSLVITMSSRHFLASAVWIKTFLSPTLKWPIEPVFVPRLLTHPFEPCHNKLTL